MARRYLTVALALLLAGAPAAAGQQAAAPALQAPAPSPEAALVIFIDGVPMGREQVTVTSTPDAWVVQSSGRLGNPINMTTSRFEVKYDREWRPVTMDIEAVLRNQPMIIRTVFANGTASSDVIQSGAQSQKSDTVAADTVVLPNMFFAAYEALARRLQATKVPADLRAYVAPHIEIALQVLGVTSERIRTSERSIAAKRYTLVFGNQGGPVPGELWADEDGRLLRFRVPTQSLEVARDDVASVSSRVERLGRAGDEQVFIPANGFNLAGTVSSPPSPSAPSATAGQGRQAPSAPSATAGQSPQTPAAASAKAAVTRLPAVVLVPGSGLSDRDEAVSGVPIFAQLANVIADAGFIVVRYDKRGVGQSGGRDESAGIPDYAEDVRAVVRFLERRKDVDPKRIALVGYSEGGMIAMLAASQMKKQVAALALLATPGTPGGELFLEQQRRLLDGMSIPDEEKRSRMALQERIQVAVQTGYGWETIPAAYRRQADTAWFRSFLQFRPGELMPKVEQPLAVIHGDRDRQVVVRHANLLIELANARKKNAGADLFIVEGVNHLLVPAPTGEVAEYAALEDKNVSVKVVDALASWLKDRLHVAAAGAGR